MANPMYGQNKADTDVNLYGRGKCEIVSVAAGDHVSLTAEQSGAFVVMAPNSTEITLPVAEAGLQFTIAQSGPYDTAVCLVHQGAAADDFKGGIYGTTQGESAGTDSDFAELDGSNTKITFSSASLTADRVYLVCDGTYWYVEAIVGNTGGITFDD